MAAPYPKPTKQPTWASGATVVLPWQASTAYAAGVMATNGGNVYAVVIAGTSAGSGGPTGVGSSITDNTITWRYLGKAGTAGGITEPPSGRKSMGWLAGEEPPHGYFNWLANTTNLWTLYLETFTASLHTWTNGIRFQGPPAWAPSTAYVVGEYVYRVGNVYVCTVAGTSFGSGGPSGTGTGIVDGTVTWNYAGEPFQVDKEANFGAEVFFADTATFDNDVLITGALSGSSGEFTGNVSAGAGLTVTQSVSNQPGTTSTGNGSGDGGVFTGGATGDGVTTSGGASGGRGVVANATGNNAAGVFTGAGTGAGITSTGGATGAGGVFTGGATGGRGLTSTGTGSNEGALITGAAGAAGAVLKPGTAATSSTPQYALIAEAGWIKFQDTGGSTAVSPAYPFSGMANVLTALNLPKAWGALTAGNGNVTNFEGFNCICSIPTLGPNTGSLGVTMPNPMDAGAGIHYVVVPSVQGTNPLAGTARWGAVDNTSFIIDIIDNAGVKVDLTTNTSKEISFVVFGRQ